MIIFPKLKIVRLDCTRPLVYLSPWCQILSIQNKIFLKNNFDDRILNISNLEGILDFLSRLANGISREELQNFIKKNKNYRVLLKQLWYEGAIVGSGLPDFGVSNYEIQPYETLNTHNKYIIISKKNGTWMLMDKLSYEKLQKGRISYEILENLYCIGIAKIKNKVRRIKFPSRMTFNPSFIEFVVTLECPLKCIYCYMDAGKNSFIKKSLLEKLEERFIELAQKRSITIQPFGGEPLLIFDDLKKMLLNIREKSKYKVNMVIQTSGAIMTNKMAEELHELDIGIGISIDGLPHHQNFQRPFKSGKPSYDRVIRSIELLKNNGYENLGAILTLTSKNISDIKEIVRHFAIDLGLRGLRINPIYKGGRGRDRDDLSITPSQFLAAKKIAFEESYRCFKEGYPIRLARTHSIIINLTSLLKESLCHSRGCRAGSQMFGVNMSGDVFPCPHLYDVPKFKLGNVFENNFEEIHKKFLSFPMSKRSFGKNKSCDKCSWKNFCDGDCRSFSYHQTGNIESHSPLCVFTKNYYYYLLNFISSHDDILEVYS